MKKLLMILLGLQAIAFAQTIPNGAFEKWTLIQYDNPDNWYSANMDKAVESAIYPITKVSGSSGFAIRMETKSYQSQIVESWISTSDGDPRQGEGGYPYSQAPATLTGKYRCNILPGDIGFLIAIFKKNGQIMGSAQGLFTGSVSGFNNFSFPVQIGGTPDSVLMAAGSSNLINEIGIQVGSWLELDELAFGGTGITQPILNGNFENWTNVSTSQVQDWFMFGDNGVSRVNDPFRGAYAIRLRTYIDPQDGLRQCGIKLSDERDGNLVKRGVPYKVLQDTLFGFYKLSTPGIDNAYIFARTFKNGTQVGWFGENLNPTASWTKFQVIINNVMEPDSLDVVVESSSQGSMVNGTTLTIDEIQLASSKLNTSGIRVHKPFNKAILSLYPNPSREELFIQTDLTGILDVCVYDMGGEEMLKQRFGSDQTRTLDIRQLQAGLYVVVLVSEEGNRHHSKFMKN